MYKYTHKTPPTNATKEEDPTRRKTIFKEKKKRHNTAKIKEDPRLT
jgi:hypothetical protein